VDNIVLPPQQVRRLTRTFSAIRTANHWNPYVSRRM